MMTAISRRQFVIATLSAAGGLAVGIRWTEAADALPQGGAIADAEPAAGAVEVGAWVVIEPDGAVVIRVAKAEMGQGILTSLPMLLVEELACDWSRVRVEYASAHRNLVSDNVYGGMGTGGSRSIRTSWKMLQQAGASARVRLVIAAAERWGVTPDSCSAKQGIVLHAPSGRAATYAELSAAAARVAVSQEPEIRSPERYELAGKPLPRLDVPAKVAGRAQFGIDTRLPGMLYGAVATCPVFGGTVAGYDAGAISARRGVKAVVPVEGGVVVVADNFWRAKEALAALPITWNEGAAATSDSEQFRAMYRNALDETGANARSDGDITAGFAAATKMVTALYEVPHLAHATMEPLNCTAHVQADRVDVWLGTQFPEAAAKTAAEIAGLRPEQAFVHNCFLGGGFGRRAVNDELRQAVTVSKAVRAPVKLVWTREEDMRHDRYRPQAALRFRAGLMADGAVSAWEMRTAVGSIRRSLGWDKVENGIEPMAVEGLANTPYAAGAVKVDCVLRNTHVPVMFWRSVGSSQNAFAVESFIDELALAAGVDPLQFRRKLLIGKPDFVRVLDVLAEKGDWGKKLPTGFGRGVAIHECFGTIVGETVEASVTGRGDVRVHRVVAVVDCGHVVNPRTVAMQIESGVIYGLTAALTGEITIRNGRVEQGNFDDYPVLRMADAPTIETHLALSGGTKWGGVGEPGTPPVAPALCNAIFAATGQRIRSLPIRNTQLSGRA